MQLQDRLTEQLLTWPRCWLTAHNLAKSTLGTVMAIEIQQFGFRSNLKSIQLCSHLSTVIPTQGFTVARASPGPSSGGCRPSAAIHSNPTSSKPAAKKEGIRELELVFCPRLVFGLVLFITQQQDALALLCLLVNYRVCISYEKWIKSRLCPAY